jgi:signal transduction histidine kinase
MPQPAADRVWWRPMKDRAALPVAVSCLAAALALLVAPALPWLGWLVGLPALAAISWLLRRPPLAAAAAPALPAAAAASAADALKQRRAAAIGRLAPGVAHDFNNVLGVLSNSVYLFERHAGQPAPEPLRAPLAAAQRAIKNGSRLTGQLQRFADQRSAGARALVLSIELNDAAELLRTALGRRFELALAVAPGTRRALADPSALELELLEAALDIRQRLPGGAKLRLDAHDHGDGVRVAIVADDAAAGSEPLAAVQLAAAPAEAAVQPAK